MPTLFTRIIHGEIPAEILYKDDLCIVILDIFPINKGHALVISRKEYETILECPDEELSHLFKITKMVAAKMEQVLAIDGYNILVNNKSASGQEVPHLHIHIIPRYEGDCKTPKFSKEQYTPGEIGQVAEKLRL